MSTFFVNLALYFECQINKSALLQTVFSAIFPTEIVRVIHHFILIFETLNQREKRNFMSIWVFSDVALFVSKASENIMMTFSLHGDNGTCSVLKGLGYIKTLTWILKLFVSFFFRVLVILTGNVVRFLWYRFCTFLYSNLDLHAQPSSDS